MVAACTAVCPIRMTAAEWLGAVCKSTAGGAQLPVTAPACLYTSDWKLLYCLGGYLMLPNRVARYGAHLHAVAAPLAQPQRLVDNALHGPYRGWQCLMLEHWVERHDGNRVPGRPRLPMHHPDIAAVQVRPNAHAVPVRFLAFHAYPVEASPTRSLLYTPSAYPIR